MTFQRRFDLYNLSATTASTPPSSQDDKPVSAFPHSSGPATAPAAVGTPPTHASAGPGPSSADRKSNTPRVTFVDSLQRDDMTVPVSVPTHRTSNSPNPIIRTVKRPLRPVGMPTDSSDEDQEPRPVEKRQR